MDLIACSAPAVALEATPPAALRSNTATERWEAFWGADDVYYVKFTRIDDGGVQWYHLPDSDRLRQRGRFRASAVRSMRGVVTRDIGGRPHLQYMIWARSRKKVQQ